MAKRSSNDLPLAAESQWKRRMTDALSDFLASHIAGEYEPIPLGDWRINNYGTNAQNGGILTTETAPSIQRVAGKAPDIAWAATQVVPIIGEVMLPYDYQPDTNIIFHMAAEQVGSNDAIDLDIACYLTRIGSAVTSDVAPAVSTANRLTQGGTRGTSEDIAITVLDATADFAQGDKLSFVITPDAHANDAVYLQMAYIEYTKGGDMPDADQVYQITT